MSSRSAGANLHDAVSKTLCTSLHDIVFSEVLS